MNNNSALFLFVTWLQKKNVLLGLEICERQRMELCVVTLSYIYEQLSCTKGAEKRVLTTRYLWIWQCWGFDIGKKKIQINFSYINFFNFQAKKSSLSTFKNAENLCHLYEIVGFLKSCSQSQSGHQFSFKIQQLTRPKTPHRYFQKKVRTGQTLYFCISLL